MEEKNATMEAGSKKENTTASGPQPSGPEASSSQKTMIAGAGLQQKVEVHTTGSAASEPAPRPAKTIRTPLKLGRKSRFGEKIAEASIRTLAFVSFAAIILIFVFVFREAAPMFYRTAEQGELIDSTSTTSQSVSTDSTASSAAATPGTVSYGSTKEKFKAATKVETKVSATGEKIKVVKNGGAVEQEIYDPLADDAPTEKPAAKADAKIIDSTKAIAQNAVKAAPKKKVAKKLADSTAAIASTSSKDSTKTPDKATQPKKDLTYTSTTNGGKVSQDVYDPFANETGVATLNSSKKKDTSSTAAIAAATIDSNALKLAQAEADSTKAKEQRDAEERKHVTNLSHLLGTNWQPVSTVPKYGLMPLFVGTLKVTLLSILFGAPIAILAALFTSTFAPKWAREIVKPAIELLAGFPSVVIGFFALIVLATIFQNFFHYQYRLNSLLGGVAMSFAVIPIIYTIAEDALVAVPHSLKEASDALGASKWQTAFKVVLPAAIPGVFAAVVLGFGRAFGETMIALMATGNAPLTNWSILEPVRTFSATIGAEMAEVVFGDQHYNVLFFIGSLLFIFTFTMNSVVEFWVRKRLLTRIQGKIA